MKKHTHGFTIVELAVVIVVIGILASITVVSYSGIQRNARDVALHSDLKNTAETVELWLAKRGNSIGTLRTLYGGNRSSWVVGDGASNAISDTAIRWNDISSLPPVRVSPGSTLEIVVRYSNEVYPATAINQRMVDENLYCLTIASPGSSYDYVPGSGIHGRYDRMLYYDSYYGKTMTMADMVELYNDGRPITCEAHAVYWLNATT